MTRGQAKKPVYVDRAELMWWNQGYALYRSGKKCIAPDELKCTAALKAIEKGEPVILTVDGAPYSTVKNGKEVRVKVAIKPKRKA